MNQSRLPYTAILSTILFFACMASGIGAHSQEGTAETLGTPQYLPFVLRGTPGTSTWRPAPGTSWQIQFVGDLDTSFDVQVYDLDLFNVTGDRLNQLHALGRKVICYFSAGSWEEWRPDAAQFPESVKGNELEGWPGENGSTSVRSQRLARL